MTSPQFSLFSAKLCIITAFPEVDRFELLKTGASEVTAFVDPEDDQFLAAMRRPIEEYLPVPVRLAAVLPYDMLTVYEVHGS